MRALILEADPGMTEECKWVKPTNPLGVPVWSHAGIVCTGEAYTKVVKLTFARGGQDPRPITPLQFQPGRQHAKGDRHPRRGEGRRERVQGAREGRGRPEWPPEEETVDPAGAIPSRRGRADVAARLKVFQKKPCPRSGGCTAPR